ncbi:FxDxF family PEP-CTERM protein [Duganella levis]|uniref:PEP-CTERM sorting domain-containing protein n=1 Tax=Duganella levis TaxID=2692169 RepID=A0ABW9VTJ8_9BURK|nr:FxDxF family PEP-CTERM protein [Duganella levis]MYN24948.1 PEP-CTERM sorting domain-containing protein [Duganella levis]
MKIKSILLASMIVGANLIGVSAFAAEKTVNLSLVSDMEGGFNAHFGNDFNSNDMNSVFSDKYKFTLTGAYDSAASVTSSFLKSGTIKDLLITSFNIVQYDPLTSSVLHTYTGINTTGGITDNWELSASGLTAGSYYVQVGGKVVGNGGGSYGTDLTISMAPVPEPETYAMLGLGLGLMGVVARRKKAKAA